ncbi:hypothetical protein [Dichotomicrobium thermohalophilum]|uniref:HdeA/HdeB family protein n=1 Tax=Dichotomicrobium thermohalophilum TaxID=933063 RepID=A0A397Q5S6_9HYPH|nr:hypothetical protein [Dichotomicrobium thermohalophilum]RIA56452.1 hypothetical protein BXY53_1558 [Dichotomicrobium thermohalophilum]
MICKRGAAALAALTLGAGLGASSVAALPLTQAACERYSGERQTLIRLGVRDHYLKGADWAQANLTQPQLDLIHRYIRIEEALKFRCPEEFAALPVDAADVPRRLDVMPPVPGQKPPAKDSGTGVTRNETPPPPARGPKEQG